jgi:hypothetical protein
VREASVPTTPPPVQPAELPHSAHVACVPFLHPIFLRTTGLCFRRLQAAAPAPAFLGLGGPTKLAHPMGDPPWPLASSAGHTNMQQPKIEHLSNTESPSLAPEKPSVTPLSKITPSRCCLAHVRQITRSLPPQMLKESQMRPPPQRTPDCSLPEPRYSPLQQKSPKHSPPPKSPDIVPPLRNHDIVLPHGEPQLRNPLSREPPFRPYPKTRPLPAPSPSPTVVFLGAAGPRVDTVAPSVNFDTDPSVREPQFGPLCQ